MAALRPGSLLRLLSHSSSEMTPSPSLSSVSAIFSNGTNAGACPSGQPSGGGIGFLRGSDLSMRCSSFLLMLPLWSQSICENTMIPGVDAASSAEMLSSSFPSALSASYFFFSSSCVATASGTVGMETPPPIVQLR